MDNKDERLQKVRIAARGPQTTIELDGELVDFRAVGAYTVSQLPGEPAHVVLHLTDPADTRFDGMARVSVADMPDPGPAAAVFLAAISAEALERAALARSDLGTEPYSLTNAMLTQLGEWARGH
ncbi:hypothetical protein ACFRNT_29595 [Streptomyces sp. NPDC056697]|uniref:hypothetical protein n=1 Tax=Streptomyces sp. NPDC056697 TaxID=3345915 RepID=UPI0036C478E4